MQGFSDNMGGWPRRMTTGFSPYLRRQTL